MKAPIVGININSNNIYCISKSYCCLVDSYHRWPQYYVNATIKGDGNCSVVIGMFVVVFL